MPATWKRIITTGDNSNYKNSQLVASDLPIATSSAVGGVSIGSGLSVNGSGVLTADSQSGTVQTLSISGNTITLSDSGGSVTVPDNDTQDLSISGRTVSLTNGGSVTIPSSNVSTNLGVTTSANDFTITSSDGTNAQVPKATTSAGGAMGSGHVTAINANSAKVSCTEANVKSILSSLDSNDTLYIGDTGNDSSVNIRGNLTVTGTTTTVNTTELKVSDNVITLNSDVTGTPGQNAGIEVERGTSANPSLIWAENTDRFMMDYNGSKGNLAIVREESSAPSSSDGMVNGKGGFWLDTANTQMYVMLAG